MSISRCTTHVVETIEGWAITHIVQMKGLFSNSVSVSVHSHTFQVKDERHLLDPSSFIIPDQTE